MNGKLLHSVAFTQLPADPRPRLDAVERFGFGPGPGPARGPMAFGLVAVFDDEPAFHAYVTRPARAEVAALTGSVSRDLADGVRIAR
ncbi:hypothetical protein ACH4ZX_15500 [Streptomyces sp. NPDC020490]|uniref:hypothetical protein n=1 Tax=Streptomyces sp. NPDC020490 TaxID=3365078 RepID=UPI0037A1249D